MDRRVTPPKRVTSPTWGPPPPCKQALTLSMASNEPGFYIPAAELVALAIAGCLQDGQPDGL